MTPSIEELDYQVTPIGEVTLRRRRSPSVPGELVYEVRVDHQMLMSSSVNISEKALATVALDRLGDRPCDVLIGGLGLGYTAAAALDYDNVRRVEVIELLGPVVAWHRDRLLPVSDQLLDDERCELIEGDFFERVNTEAAERAPRFDAILMDIDHGPASLLRPEHEAFYSDAPLRRMKTHLRDGGVFALWSAGQPAGKFIELVGDVFDHVSVDEVSFFNPHMHERDTNWIIVARG